MDLNIVTQTILACLAVGTLMGAGLTCRAMLGAARSLNC